MLLCGVTHAYCVWVSVCVEQQTRRGGCGEDDFMARLAEVKAATPAHGGHASDIFSSNASVALKAQYETQERHLSQISYVLDDMRSQAASTGEALAAGDQRLARIDAKIDNVSLSPPPTHPFPAHTHMRTLAHCALSSHTY